MALIDFVRKNIKEGNDDDTDNLQTLDGIGLETYGPCSKTFDFGYT